MCDEQGRHARVVHPDADAVAGDAWLGHLEARGPDPIAITDADLVVSKPVDGEILTELSVAEADRCFFG